MWFSRLALALVLCVPAFGTAYTSTGTVAFTGATGSTQTGITLTFSFNDIKLSNGVAGSQILHLCSRNGLNVPCDFVFTGSPSDCTTGILTGSYAWGFDGDYSATLGTGHGWVMIPSYTTGGVTPTVCIGNVAISTYQGGAAGSEYDSTVGVWQFSNGSTLNVSDFSANNITTTNSGATATTGKIDGAAAFVRASSQYVSAATNTGFNSTSFTAGAWFKTSSSAQQDIMRRDNASSRSFLLRVDGGQVMAILIYGSIPSVGSIASTYADGAWHYAVMTASLSAGTTTLTLFVDGVSQGTASTTGSNPSITVPLDIGRYSASNEYFDGSIDSVRFQNAVRSANWIATEYANQNAPPALSALTPVSLGSNCTLSLLGVGC